MLAEGTISVDECEELLESLKGREARAEEVQEQEAKALGPRPRWPYVLLAVVLVVGLFTGTLLLFARPRHRWMLPVTWPLIGFGGGIVGTLVFIGWAWMLIDCIARPFRDFRLLFTRNREYEKWIWIAVIFFGGWLGALVYFVVIRQPARAIQVRTGSPVPSAEISYVSGPRARSLKGWVFLLLVILLLIWVIPALLSYLPSGSIQYWLTSHNTPIRLDRDRIYFRTWPLLSAVASVGLAAMACAVFWLWMLVDCIARDYREFGTLITSDQTVDKLLWVVLVVFTFIVGATAYHISVRRRKHPGKSAQAKEAPYPPSPRARSLKGLAVLLPIALILIWLMPMLFSCVHSRPLPARRPGAAYYYIPFWNSLNTWPGSSAAVSVIFLGIICVLFWLWMLIDCIARDYREFGTLITSDSTADKLLWVILVLSTFIVGAIAYHIAVRRRLRLPQPVQA